MYIYIYLFTDVYTYIYIYIYIYISAHIPVPLGEPSPEVGLRVIVRGSARSPRIAPSLSRLSKPKEVGSTLAQLTDPTSCSQLLVVSEARTSFSCHAKMGYVQGRSCNGWTRCSSHMPPNQGPAQMFCKPAALKSTGYPPEDTANMELGPKNHIWYMVWLLGPDSILAV